MTNFTYSIIVIIFFGLTLNATTIIIARIDRTKEYTSIGHLSKLILHFCQLIFGAGVVLMIISSGITQISSRSIGMFSVSLALLIVGFLSMITIGLVSKK